MRLALLSPSLFSNVLKITGVLLFLLSADTLWYVQRVVNQFILVSSGNFSLNNVTFYENLFSIHTIEAISCAYLSLLPSHVFSFLQDCLVSRMYVTHVKKLLKVMSILNFYLLKLNWTASYPGTTTPLSMCVCLEI